MRAPPGAAAYGIAVIGAMVIDTMLLGSIARRVWRWPAAAAFAMLLFLLTIDVTFLTANGVKVAQGGFVPLLR